MTELVVKIYGGNVRLRTGLRVNAYLQTDNIGIQGRSRTYHLGNPNYLYRPNYLVRQTTNLTTLEEIRGYRITILRTPNNNTGPFTRIQMKIHWRRLNMTCTTCHRPPPAVAQIPNPPMANAAHLTAPNPNHPPPRIWPVRLEDVEDDRVRVNVEVDGNFDGNFRTQIRTMLNEVEALSKVRFHVYPLNHHQNNMETPRIIFRPVAEACETSHVGYLPNQNSEISLGVGCRTPLVIRHELGHAMARIHEFARANRDHHLEILWHNIDPAWWPQFEMQVEVQVVIDGHMRVLRFDDNSTMMYPPVNSASLRVGGHRQPCYRRRRVRAQQLPLGPLASGLYTVLDEAWYSTTYPEQQ